MRTYIHIHMYTYSLSLSYTHTSSASTVRAWWLFPRIFLKSYMSSIYACEHVYTYIHTRFHFRDRSHSHTLSLSHTHLISQRSMCLTACAAHILEDCKTLGRFLKSQLYSHHIQRFKWPDDFWEFWPFHAVYLIIEMRKFPTVSWPLN